jgi:signal transduction histidine kinase
VRVTLKRKLSLGFLAAVLGSLIIAGFISNVMINKIFNTYLKEENNSKINKAVTMANELYDENNKLSDSAKQQLQRYSQMENMYIEILDSDGGQIYTSGMPNLNGMKKMGAMMGSRMHNLITGDNGDYTEEKHDLIKGSKKTGTIICGYFSSSLMTSGAVTFIMTLNRSFVISAIIALVFGLLLSIMISNQLSKPLVKITHTANEMRNGNLQLRSDVNSSTKEIQDLSLSINYLAETLNHQEIYRKRMTSDMAHEIRTPLTTLKTHIEALIDGIWEPTTERFESFYEEIERLNKLVDNLRDLSKLEESKLNLIKSKFNLSEEMRKIILNFKPLFDKSNFNLMLEIDKNIYVIMDKDKLKQIMHNVIFNAYKYLNTNGTVLVSLKSKHENAIIKVSDTGTGISKEDLPHIFERFYRSDSSRDSHTGGSGLGLTITKTLIEAHAGSISVNSKLGHGSEFTIVMPVVIVNKNN